MDNSLLSDLEEKIKTLTETAWVDRRLNWSEVENWLNQFETLGDEGKLQFLFLLSNFMYFGRREMKEMLKSLYRDIYKYPIVARVREENNDTKNRDFLENSFKEKLSKTRFLGIGNPSESGTHLLYYFRQENYLSKDLFINGHEIFHRNLDNQKIEIKNSSVERYIFIDDLTCTGSQAIFYSRGLVNDIKALSPNSKVCYFVLFATESAISAIRISSAFDEVKSLFELDQSFRCFENESRYYHNIIAPIDRIKAKSNCENYDSPLSKMLCSKEGKNTERDYVLGFDNSQLLLAFYHNTPDNVPPIFWCDEKYEPNKRWRPIFQRFHKVY